MLRMRPHLAVLLASTVLAAAATAAAGAPPPPTQLVCARDGSHRWRLSLDAAGLPRQVGAGIAAGTRECDFASEGPPTALAGGGWRFQWDDAVLGQRQRVDVRRAGASGFVFHLDPAACGALKLPATVTLSPGAPGCTQAVDRDGAFEQFWQQLREALARGDGGQLQQLALPQLEFVEGPDIVRAPATVLRGAARCLPGVPATTQRLELRDLLARDAPPRPDMPPLSRKGDSRIDIAGAMSLRWTAQGWRIDGFNTSPEVFRRCS